MEAAASSVHPSCHRQQDPLQVVHFYQTTHCTSLNAAVSHHTSVFNQVTRYKVGKLACVLGESVVWFSEPLEADTEIVL